MKIWVSDYYWIRDFLQNSQLKGKMKGEKNKILLSFVLMYHF